MSAIDSITRAGELLIDRLVPDKQKAASDKTAFAAALMDYSRETDAGQIAVNVEEAKSADPFTSRWRPALGWVCVFGLAYQYVFYPLAHPFLFALNPLDTSELFTLVVGMLGMSGIRSYDKARGVAS